MIAYTLRRRARMRSIRLTIQRDGAIIVSAAKHVSEEKIKELLERKRTWIEKHQTKMKYRSSLVPAASTADYQVYKKQALQVACERVRYFSSLYGLQPTAISIRNPRTRWGSCSRQGRISFSYRLVFLSPQVRDYLIVHELCHLKEFNHSVRFWRLVEQAVPTYRDLRRILKVA